MQDNLLGHLIRIKNVKDLIAFCKKYTMPIQSEPIIEMYRKNNEVCMRCPIEVVLAECKQLSDNYKIIHSFVHNDISAMNRIAEKISPNIDSKQLIASLINDIYSCKLANCKTKFRLDIETFKPESYISVGNLFEIAYFELFKMLQDADYKRFSICKKCSQPFPSIHGNAKYCEECIQYRNSIKQKNYRERKNKQRKE